MDFTEPDDFAVIRTEVRRLCDKYGNEYWRGLEPDRYPEEFVADLTRHGWLGALIPEQYGGGGLSLAGASVILEEISASGGNPSACHAQMYVMGTLLRHGSDEQKQHYLPRLARGEEIPCFALTSPTAGSDAAGMNDTGIVCKQVFEGRETLGLRLNWNKRYITLAPIATLLGLAFKVRDPEHLLGEEVELGITCALIPTDTPGVEIGNRHMPVGAFFMNGPTRGRDVFIPLEWIIGGRERIGQGWRMLMQSLAAGRAVSLPATGVAGGKMAALMSGAYARIRKQFDMPIGRFEGIQEPLARIAGRTYRMDAARRLTLVALDEGERPGVLSAILKYQLTEGNRQCIADAMDIHGGKGVITGPGNYLARAWSAVPIAITVEGANILTRSLIIFGQGAIRAHPWLLKEMAAARDPSPGARKAFDKALFGHVGYMISNMVRALMLGLSGGYATRAPIKGPTSRYFQQMTRMSAAFCFVADLVLVTLGGGFKFREMLSGRLADALIHLYLGSAVLKRFEDDGRPEEDLPLLTWAMDDSLHTIQESLKGVLQNFPVPGMGRLIKWIIFPFGSSYAPPGDETTRQVADILLTENDARDRLVDGVYLSDQEDAPGNVQTAFHLVLTATQAENAIRNALKEPVTFENHEELVGKAVESGVITEEQATSVRLARPKISSRTCTRSADEVGRSKIATISLNGPAVIRTASPGFLFHFSMVPSATDSGNPGTLSSIAMLFPYRSYAASIGRPRACATSACCCFTCRPA